MKAHGIYRFGRDFATLSLAPRTKAYDERIIRKGKKEFRVWDPNKSKLGAALRKGLSVFPIKKSAKVLYLGIASGTTASHISDIIGNEGIIYGVEFSPRSMRELLSLCRRRRNIVPVLDDARLPANYANRITEVDVIYADVAQRDQSEILMRNADIFLKSGGYVMIAIKARSIDVTKKPKEIFAKERKKLEKKFRILQQINLEPFEKDHAFFVGRLI